jgi:hypothetical protein
MKRSMTIRVDDDLLERAKNAVWTVGRGLTLTGLIEEGLLAQVKAIEKKHNKGKPFGQRDEELPHSSKRATPS